MKRLKMLRKEKGITQENLSAMIGISQVTVSEYENGRNFPSADNLIKLADFFGVSTDYLLERSDIKGVLKPGKYNGEETELLNGYRSLPPSERALARAYLQALCDSKALRSSGAKRERS